MIQVSMGQKYAGNINELGVTVAHVEGEFELRNRDGGTNPALGDARELMVFIGVIREFDVSNPSYPFPD